MPFSSVAIGGWSYRSKLTPFAVRSSTTVSISGRLRGQQRHQPTLARTGKI